MKMKYRGYSLIEVVVVIVILSIIAAIASKVLQAGFNAYITSQNIATANAQARVAFEKMTRDIHAIASPASISTATASQLSFTEINGSSVTYQLTGTQLMQGSNVLADGVHSLTFSYWDQNAASTTVAANICYVTVLLNITSGGVNYTMRTTVSTMNYC
jgi:prepilin-type N-terminal cleavage/methylation domain-containing protein